MAEALGVAGSVISLVGFVGQLTQGVVFLCGFLSDIKDAPEDIENLNTVLRLLSIIPEDVQKYDENSPAPQAAVIYCETWVAKLKNLVQRYTLNAGEKGVKRVWSQLNVAFRNKKFKEYIEGLEMAKSMILHAQVDLARSSIRETLNATSDIQQSISKLSSDQSTVTATVTETRQAIDCIQSGLNNFPVTVIQPVVSEFSKTFSRSQVSHVEFMTEIRNKTVAIEQNSQDIKVAVQALLQNADDNVSHLAALLQPFLVKTISDHLQSTTSPADPGDAKVSAVTSTQDSMDIRRDPQTTPPSKGQGIQSLYSLSSTATVRRWIKQRKTYKFWFGRLRIATSIHQQWDSRLVCGKLQRTEMLEIDATFIPATWLIRTGFALDIKKAISSLAAPIIQCSLRPVSIITWDNPIKQALTEGRLSDVKNTISERKAHLFSVFPDGSGLILQCIVELRQALFVSFHDFLEGLDDVEDDDILSSLPTEFVDRLMGIMEIVRWLIQHGCEIGLHDCEAIFSTLHHIFSGKYNGSSSVAADSFTESEYGTDLEELGTLMLANSKVSPFYSQENGVLTRTDTIVEIMDNCWWYFMDMIANGSPLDGGTLSTLATLEKLWRCRPYALPHEEDYCDNGSESFTAQLVQTAIRGKLWLSGDDLELDQCRKFAYQAIRGVLTFSSPYLPRYTDFGSRTSLNVVSFRKDMAETVARILEYDDQLAFYNHETGSLTEIALRWQTLDVWIVALDEAGFEPFSVFDRRIWDFNAHLYYSFGFISFRGGTFVSLTSDSTSRRVCLLVEERGMKFNVSQDQMHPRNPSLEKLTSGWKPEIEFSRTHCELYPAEKVKGDHYPPPLKEVVERAELAYGDGCTLKELGNGEFELIIECSDMGERWEDLCDQVDRELGRVPCDSADDEEDNTTDDEEEMAEGENQSPGVLHKAAQFGKYILSAIL